MPNRNQELVISAMVKSSEPNKRASIGILKDQQDTREQNFANRMALMGCCYCAICRRSMNQKVWNTMNAENYLNLDFPKRHYLLKSSLFPGILGMFTTNVHSHFPPSVLLFATAFQLQWLLLFLGIAVVPSGFISRHLRKTSLGFYVFVCDHEHVLRSPNKKGWHRC